MAHVKNKFEKKTKTGRHFHGAGIFFRQCRRRGKFLRPRIALQNACQKESERISTMPFFLWNFSPGDKIENCSAQLFAVRFHGRSSLGKLISHWPLGSCSTFGLYWLWMTVSRGSYPSSGKLKLLLQSTESHTRV